MKEALATLRQHKNDLSRQEYKTLCGQIIAGDTNAARKGLRKILKRKEATA
jgi:DNA-binding FadR family transcriptional regulator